MEEYIKIRQNLYDFLSIQDLTLLEGDFAEVGVWAGHSARVLIDFCAGDKKLFLYDTFEGIPYHDEKVDNYHRKGDIACPITLVQEKLKDFADKVIITVGACPESAQAQANHKFCLVNLDADVYQSTWECLVFFYPLLVKGGILMIQDDYGHVNTEGATLAVDMFLEDKKELLQRFHSIAYIRKE